MDVTAVHKIYNFENLIIPMGRYQLFGFFIFGMFTFKSSTITITFTTYILYTQPQRQ